VPGLSPRTCLLARISPASSRLLLQLQQPSALRSKHRPLQLLAGTNDQGQLLPRGWVGAGGTHHNVL
jgi:hypothetical protein